MCTRTKTFIIKIQKREIRGNVLLQKKKKKKKKSLHKVDLQPVKQRTLQLHVYRFVLLTCSYKRIALYSVHACSAQCFLLVVLCLKEVEFFLYAVTWFTHCELKGLPRLWRTLKQTNNRTSDGTNTTNKHSSSTFLSPSWWTKWKWKYFSIQCSHYPKPSCFWEGPTGHSNTQMSMDMR